MKIDKDIQNTFYSLMDEVLQSFDSKKKKLVKKYNKLLELYRLTKAKCLTLDDIKKMLKLAYKIIPFEKEVSYGFYEIDHEKLDLHTQLENFETMLQEYENEMFLKLHPQNEKNVAKNEIEKTIQEFKDTKVENPYKDLDVPDIDSGTFNYNKHKFLNDLAKEDIDLIKSEIERKKQESELPNQQAQKLHEIVDEHIEQQKYSYWLVYELDGNNKQKSFASKKALKRFVKNNNAPVLMAYRLNNKTKRVKIYKLK